CNQVIEKQHTHHAQETSEDTFPGNAEHPPVPEQRRRMSRHIEKDLYHQRKEQKEGKGSQTTQYINNRNTQNLLKEQAKGQAEHKSREAADIGNGHNQQKCPAQLCARIKVRNTGAVIDVLTKWNIPRKFDHGCSLTTE